MKGGAGCPYHAFSLCHCEEGYKPTAATERSDISHSRRIVIVLTNISRCSELSNEGSINSF